ncbi:TPA: hypothetical protein HA251_02690 [Candidatus Woesearchaeota archaeon]|nr:hypothetical protein [Candidatus Woesearchaeota archaeon]
MKSNVIVAIFAICCALVVALTLAGTAYADCPPHDPTCRPDEPIPSVVVGGEITDGCPPHDPTCRPDNDG